MADYPQLAEAASLEVDTEKEFAIMDLLCSWYPIPCHWYCHCGFLQRFYLPSDLRRMGFDD